jgi:hypothetical protein
MKYVLNATNANLMYAFFVPIVCRMWRAIEYEPIVIILGSPSEWLAAKPTECILKHIQRNTQNLIYIERISGLDDSTVTQVSRLFGSVYTSLKAEDYILTSDVDMLPLNQEYFHQQDNHFKFHIFGADAYGGQRFPICYLGAPKNVWLQVMEITEGDLSATLRTHLDKSRNGWNYDELLFMEKITKSVYWSSQCQFINREWYNHIANRRLDRDNWDIEISNDLIDCHSLRPGYKHWERLVPVFKTFCTADDYKYFLKYKKEYDFSCMQST